MKWRIALRSSNVEDRRGSRLAGRGAAGGIGLGGIAIVVVIGLLLGKNPIELLGLLNQVQTGVPESGSYQSAPAPVDDEAAQFVASILGETEDVWSELFSGNGQRYAPPRLVLFTGQVNSACGNASSAVGPFYCPGDQKVYIDLGFFAQMRDELGGGGDFAEAYVIAHEVGHHIQTLTGTGQRINEARRAGVSVDGDGGLLVRQELQADCYAGIWAHRAQQRHDWLEPGDLEEALDTASAIGDDRLQRRSGGSVVPDSFTHGTSTQRVRWFRTGFETGDPGRCDTFGAETI